MKKGLFSILAGALLVVGCQNYDDQFSNIESQITALASQVAGLSQVQSDLTALAGTVNSLQTSVASTVDSAVNTALADGLADIATATAALETAAATAASSEDVAAIAAAVTAQGTDLDELLANSQVFTGDVVINSVATLEAFLAMGSALNILNGNLTFNVVSGMDATKVQSLVDNVLTITKDLNYTGASTEAVPTFLNLSGVQSVTIKAAGDYRFDNLVSAGNIILDNTYKSKVGIVHLGALTTYTKLSDQAGLSGTVSMTSATEFHLTSLAIPVGGALNITTKKDATVAITALTGLNSLGTTQVMTLAFDGAKDISLTNIKDGTITLANVQNATISDFYGSIDINGGVENLTVTKGVTLDISGAADLITATIDMATDYDPLVTGTALTTASAVAAYKALTFVSQDLTTATVSGKVGMLTANAQNNLTSLTVTGHATALVLTSNSDLDTLKVTDATIGNVTVNDNDNMINLTLDHTTYVTAVAGNLGRAISVDGNADLEELTIDANLIDDLSIQLNPDLVKITAGATLLTIGEATATVAIDNNDLTAVKATDNYQVATAGTVDAGVYDDGTSGMKTFKKYLGVAAKAPSASGVKVFFDNISEYSVQGGSASAVYTDTAVPAVAYNATNIYAVAYTEKNNATTTGRTTTQRATLVLPVRRDVNGADLAISLTAGTDALTVRNGGTGVKVFAGAATNTLRTVDQLVAALNGDTTVAGVSIQSDRDAFHEQIVTISYVSSDGLQETTSSTSAKLYYTYGTDPETGAAIAGQTAALGAVASGGIAAALATAFNGDTGAYTATATTNGEILITAQVSNTVSFDRGPIPHAFNTFTIVTGSPSSTKLMAGDLASIELEVAATSNVTALASGYFTLTSGDTTRSGVRVTVINNSTSIAAAVTVTVSALSSVFNSGAAANNAIERNASPLGLTTMVSAAINSSALDYAASFSDIEVPVSVASTGGTTIRSGWLAD